MTEFRRLYTRNAEQRALGALWMMSPLFGPTWMEEFLIMFDYLLDSVELIVSTMTTLSCSWA